MDRRYIAALVFALACGWWLASSPSSPVRPEPPRPARPVLSLLSRVARLALWGLAFSEPAPAPQEPPAVRGYDGHPVVSHGRGW
jgi:hypothetical protein